jgi:anti-sigma factor RsiW
MLSCRQITELVTDYAEGRLSPADAERFEGHIAECPHCLEYVRQMQRTTELIGRAPPTPPTGALRERLLEAFRGWRPTRRDGDPT